MSSSRSLSKSIDTVIIGNGPAALILSYILHGNCPFYDPTYNQHPDPILNTRLKTDLLDEVVDAEDLTAHFPSARLSYSTAALPVNVLLDTLLRPLADTEPGKFKTCVRWERMPNRAVPHICIGATSPGGQWANNPVRASWDIGALSYLDQLSLPGYTLRDHLGSRYAAEELDFLRPTRAEIADYLAAYPAAAGIDGAIAAPATVSDVLRTDSGFFIGSHSISCKHLVLASGIFSNLLPTRPPLEPLLQLPKSSAPEPPLLVVGSGFSAADVIITNLPKRPIIHIFKWDPEQRPSPLRACHKQAYPEYAGVYRQMKLAATRLLAKENVPPTSTRSSSNLLKSSKADPNYEGFPNTFIADVAIVDNDSSSSDGVIDLLLPDGKKVRRTVSHLAYVIGRRGTLSYLEPRLLTEVVGAPLSAADSERISGRTLRNKVENNLEVAPKVFVIGSLTGDSLIRHAYGSCVFAARKIMSRCVESTPIEHDSAPVGAERKENEPPVDDALAGSAGVSASTKPSDSDVCSKKDMEMETTEANQRKKRQCWGLNYCTVS